MRTSDINEMYKSYLTHIESKIFKYSDRLVALTEEKEYLWKQITANGSYFSEADIDIDTFTVINRVKYNSQTLKKYDFKCKHKDILINYTIAYMKILTLERICIDGIKEYELLKTSLPFYKYILTYMNFEFSKLVLNGNVLDLGFNLGTIFINRKERDFTNACCTKAINWGESQKVKAALIVNGETPYNKITAPDGKKWFVRFTEKYTYWWWWKIAHMSIPNAYYYKFIPTHFISGDMREKEIHDEVCNTKEGILNSKYLGNIDKLHRLYQLDPTHVLLYTNN